MESITLNQFPNYEIHPDGRVFSKGRKVFLKEDTSDKRGYKRVTLSHSGKLNRIAVHRLVALAYVPNPEGLPDVNHIDHDPTNNHYTNLEWVTHSQNMLHCHAAGRCSNLIASNVAAKLAAESRQKALEELLGDRLVSHTTEKRKSYVTYVCSGCSNTFTNRLDKPALKRGGICRDCAR